MAFLFIGMDGMLLALLDGANVTEKMSDRKCSIQDPRESERTEKKKITSAYTEHVTITFCECA